MRLRKPRLLSYLLKKTFSEYLLTVFLCQVLNRARIISRQIPSYRHKISYSILQPPLLFKYSALVFAARKRSLGKGNVFTLVCQTFCSRGGVHPLGRQPPSRPLRQTHPLADRPPWQTPPLVDAPWADTPLLRWQLKWVVRILLECILVFIWIRPTYLSISCGPECKTKLLAAILTINHISTLITASLFAVETQIYFKMQSIMYS